MTNGTTTRQRSLMVTLSARADSRELFGERELIRENRRLRREPAGMGPAVRERSNVGGTHAVFMNSVRYVQSDEAAHEKRTKTRRA